MQPESLNGAPVLSRQENCNVTQQPKRSWMSVIPHQIDPAQRRAVDSKGGVSDGRAEWARADEKPRVAHASRVPFQARAHVPGVPHHGRGVLVFHASPEEVDPLALLRERSGAVVEPTPSRQGNVGGPLEIGQWLRWDSPVSHGNETQAQRSFPWESVANRESAVTRKVLNVSVVGAHVRTATMQGPPATSGANDINNGRSPYASTLYLKPSRNPTVLCHQLLAIPGQHDWLVRAGTEFPVPVSDASLGSEGPVEEVVDRLLVTDLVRANFDIAHDSALFFLATFRLNVQPPLTRPRSGCTSKTKTLASGVAARMRWNASEGSPLSMRPPAGNPHG